MLLKKVEKLVRSELNVIIRNAKKAYLCDADYEVEIGSVSLSPYNFLTTDTGVLINSENYTTFYGHRVYKRTEGGESEVITNPPFYLECNGQRFMIGYVNTHNYLHLPDYVTSQLLYLYGGNVTAVTKFVMLIFDEDKVHVYKHSSEVSSPYYLYNVDFSYNSNAELLAKIIGLVDVYKRGYLGSKSDLKYVYFLYPYVSLALYRWLRTTLYPAKVNDVVLDVYGKLKRDVDEVLKDYEGLPDEEVLNAIRKEIYTFNKTDKLIVE